MEQHNVDNWDLKFIKETLSISSTYMSKDYDVISVFSKDDASRAVLKLLAKSSINLVCLRSAGYNNVDLMAAKELVIAVTRVPSYPPDAIAEHAATQCHIISLHLPLNDSTRYILSISELAMMKRRVMIINTGRRKLLNTTDALDLLESGHIGFLA